MFSALPGFYIDSSWTQTLNVRNLDIFYFDFLATLLFAKICSFTFTLLFAYFLSLKTSGYLFYFIFGLWFICKSCSALQELSNSMQHDHIWKKNFPPYGTQGSKSAIFVFLQQLKLCAPPLWIYVFLLCFFFLHFLVPSDRI